MILPPHSNSDHRSDNVDLKSFYATRPQAGRATQSVLPAIFLILVGSLVGCGGLSNSRPSDEEIKTAIMARGAWNPLVGRIELESVEIEQIGIFNAEKKYWPVKARVITRKIHQDAVLEYQIFRDDFGKWSARLANRS